MPGWSYFLRIVSEYFLVVYRLNVFNVSIYRSAVHPDSLQQFFRHTLTEVLTYNPLLKGRSTRGAVSASRVCYCGGFGAPSQSHLTEGNPACKPSTVQLPDSLLLSLPACCQKRWEVHLGFYRAVVQEKPLGGKSGPWDRALASGSWAGTWITSPSSLYGADRGELWPLGAVLTKGGAGWESWYCREILGLKLCGPICFSLSAKRSLSLLVGCLIFILFW